MTNSTPTKELKIEIVGEEVRISWPLPEECCELCGARARRELNKDLDKISNFKELRTYLLGAFKLTCMPDNGWHYLAGLEVWVCSSCLASYLEKTKVAEAADQDRENEWQAIQKRILERRTK